MPENAKKTLHIGADLEDIELVERFRSYCLKEDFKQKTLIQRLAEWWLGLDEPIQWLIYRGKAKEAHSQIAKEVALAEADEIVTGAEADAAKQKRKKGQVHRAKSG